MLFPRPILVLLRVALTALTALAPALALRHASLLRCFFESSVGMRMGDWILVMTSWTPRPRCLFGFAISSPSVFEICLVGGKSHSQQEPNMLARNSPKCLWKIRLIAGGSTRDLKGSLRVGWIASGTTCRQWTMQGFVRFPSSMTRMLMCFRPRSLWHLEALIESERLAAFPLLVAGYMPMFATDVDVYHRTIGATLGASLSYNLILGNAQFPWQGCGIKKLSAGLLAHCRYSANFKIVVPRELTSFAQNLALALAQYSCPSKLCSAYNNI